MSTLILLALLVASPEAPRCQEVSMVKLLAAPEKYDGRSVCVIGLLSLEFEGDAIYLHEEDYKHHLFQNALAVERNERLMRDSEKLNGKYVLIMGKFSSAPTGGPPFPGYITQVNSWLEWSDPASPARKSYRERPKQGP